jgi:SAM-dependent methyltransferase
MPIEEFPGYCAACDSQVIFTAESQWYRDTLKCPRCHSIVRERAVAAKVRQHFPDWRELAIHEIAPATRGFAMTLKSECSRYVQTHWFAEQPPGSIFEGFRNENIEAQTFEDMCFDCVLSLDVMEHVFDPVSAYREVYRTLRPGGAYIHTFPITITQIKAVIDHAVREPDGSIRHLVDPPVYHGNPIDRSGSLVTKSYGYDIGQAIASWTPFDVEISRFWDRTAGLIGSFTEVVVCRRPSTSAGKKGPGAA